MMSIINSVFEISKEFIKDPKHVTIDYDTIPEVAQVMKDTGVNKFGFGTEVDPLELEPKAVKKLVFMELLGNSINYCYWYGKYNIRPSGSDSNMMYKLLEETFEKFPEKTPDTEVIDEYVCLLSEYRFPLLEERAKHLLEAADSSTDVIREILKDQEFVYKPFETLVRTIPGYASDMFLKRASLFFIQLNRRFGWYPESIQSLPIPADYQVPKMLEHYKCIIYSEDLKNKIGNHVLIPKHSLEECEIRAATIIVSKLLSILVGWTVSDIDSWLWLRRKECSNPFHLTITTDY